MLTADTASTPSKVVAKITPQAHATPNKASMGLSSFLSSARKAPLLSAKEEVKLSRLYQASLLPSASRKVVKEGNAAYRRIVKSNILIVASMAWRYEKKGVDIDDLIQEGNMGLMEAAKRFDGSKGYRFSTYACYWIRQAMLRTIYDSSRSVRIPVYLWNLAYAKDRIKKAAELAGSPKTDEEIRAEMGLTEKAYARIHSSFFKILSIDLTANQESEINFASIPLPDFEARDYLSSSAEDYAWRTYLSDSLEDVLQAVSDESQTWGKIVRDRHPAEIGKSPLTYAQIGKKHGRGQSWSFGQYQAARQWIKENPSLGMPMVS